MIKNMVDKIIKFIHKSKYREKLLELLKDLESNNLSKYDIKVIKWKKWFKRIRVWDIRIIFVNQYWYNEIVRINNRWDIY